MESKIVRIVVNKIDLNQYIIKIATTDDLYFIINKISDFIL